MPGSAFAQLPEAAGVAAIDLGGAWQFKATDEAAWAPAEVPGSVYSDLLRAGRLEEPYYRDNELRAQWVAWKDWEYRREFTLDAAFLAHDRVFLECRGLDTIAQVYLNGTLVAETQNMFVEHEFDVTPLLRAGANRLRVVFRSALAWCREADAQDPRVTWSERLVSTRDKGYSPFLRKEACEFGWNWGIRLIRCGIWRPIRLVAYDGARLADLWVRPDLGDPALATLRVAAEVEAYGPDALELDLAVTLGEEEVARATLPVAGGRAQGELSIREPQLWWPNGWGAQPLYTVTATLRSGGRAVDRRSVRTGLRRIELVREKDARGETFCLAVNGRPVFCKGANWVPADALPERLTCDHYRHLLRSAADAHMNMLRIWGGGRYEADVFYDLCDELGLMLWHDFMFAEGPYLTTPGYLENVRAEVRSVARRLRHHPSIALWCGNNESEVNMAAGHRWLQFPAVTWQEYDAVFEGAILETLRRYDPDRPYWPSSPHHPLDRERRSPDWETASGDAHLWEVWHGFLPISAYEEQTGCRFVSEFGLQSLPAMETIRAFTRPEDRQLGAPALEHHQRVCSEGTPGLGFYVLSLFRPPARFADWVYLSQLAHGEALRTGVEAFRRNWPHTTGALYWQLNSNWPTFASDSLDYYGRWKAAHYMARRFFSPVLVSGQVRGARATLWGVNEHLHGLAATLEWALWHLGGRVVRSGQVPVALPANASTPLAELDFGALMGEDPLQGLDRRVNYGPACHYALACRLVGEAGELAANLLFFAPFKFLDLPDPALRYDVAMEDGRPVVTVAAEGFAAFVELGLAGGYARFSDNYFHLLPGEARRVRVLEAEPPGAGLAGRLYVRSLVDAIPQEAGQDG